MPAILWCLQTAVVLLPQHRLSSAVVQRGAVGVADDYDGVRPQAQAHCCRQARLALLDKRTPASGLLEHRELMPLGLGG